MRWPHLVDGGADGAAPGVIPGRCGLAWEGISMGEGAPCGLCAAAGEEMGLIGLMGLQRACFYCKRRWDAG